MEKRVYIRFDDPRPAVPLPPDGAVKKAVKSIILKILARIIPKSNPDFEELIDQVAYWKVEFDTQERQTCREIGFDKDGNSIVAMPLGNNYGYWTDNHLALEDYAHFKNVNISTEEFMNDWNEFIGRNEIIAISNKK